MFSSSADDVGLTYEQHLSKLPKASLVRILTGAAAASELARARVQAHLLIADGGYATLAAAVDDHLDEVVAAKREARRAWWDSHGRWYGEDPDHTEVWRRVEVVKQLIRSIEDLRTKKARCEAERSVRSVLESRPRMRSGERWPEEKELLDELDYVVAKANRDPSIDRLREFRQRAKQWEERIEEDQAVEADLLTMRFEMLDSFGGELMVPVASHCDWELLSRFRVDEPRTFFEVYEEVCEERDCLIAPHFLAGKVYKLEHEGWLRREVKRGVVWFWDQGD